MSSDLCSCSERVANITCARYIEPRKKHQSNRANKEKEGRVWLVAEFSFDFPEVLMYTTDSRVYTVNFKLKCVQNVIINSEHTKM